ncbi:hypothetical protein QT381_10190 [Galbitalea sp. SE-J8]|uniref:hypothetical protein n=1 Tax=Galbitalea sp. SE-J8 TaxID=3054952 RepID=UPI00259D2E42|nr:hypothetical protein [Galbitalea sp. SE-J8]MDM4763377.1 hypothetical protein [Galbitalea sp. SE-J8]
MSPFWRRRRRDLGTYEAPAPVEPPPVERVVDDGVLIAESSVRMTLRNRIVVDALRDRLDLDRDALAEVAAGAFEQLADSEWELGERERARREARRFDDPLPDADAVAEDRENERRETVHRAMSAAFAGRGRDRDALDALVERSRLEAWREIGAFLASRIVPLEPEPAPDPDYVRERAERVGAFLALDLAGLAAERGVALE